MHGGTPVFVIEDGPPPPASPKFTCHLTIPALSSPHGGYEQRSFTAVARAKKAAEHAAAEMALEFITGRGLLPPAMPALSPIQGSIVTVDEVGGSMSLTVLARSWPKVPRHNLVSLAYVYITVYSRVCAPAAYTRE